MYHIYYYLNGRRLRYEWDFSSLWAAVFKARALYEIHGVDTEVISKLDGEIMAYFSYVKTYASDACPIVVQKLVYTPLE